MNMRIHQLRPVISLVIKKMYATESSLFALPSSTWPAVGDSADYLSWRSEYMLKINYFSFNDLKACSIQTEYEKFHIFKVIYIELVNSLFYFIY